VDGELGTVLARIEVKLDAVIALGSDHETRLRKLEQRIWYATGAAAAAGAGLAQFLSK
jgi:hypothetical protein